MSFSGSANQRSCERISARRRATTDVIAQASPTNSSSAWRTMGILQAGMRALDLGTGTGTIARGLALRGCEVTGLDRSAPLMEQAAELDRAAGVVVKYVNAPAEDTGLPATEFDLVTAGQCWHWFDRPRAACGSATRLEAGRQGW